MNSLEAFETVKSYGDNTSIILVVSVVLPVVFKIFLNIGIIFDMVWDLFNML